MVRVFKYSCYACGFALYQNPVEVCVGVVYFVLDVFF